MRKVAFILLWFFVFSIPCENILVLPGIGTIARLTGMIAFPVGIFAILTDRQIRPPTPLLLLMVFFLLFGTLTYFWTIDAESTIVALRTHCQLLAFVWLIYEYSPTSEKQVRLISAYVLGAYAASIISFVQFFSSKQVVYLRHAAMGFNPNDFGLILALGIPMGWYLGLLSKDKLMRWVYWSYVVVGLSGIFLTASRSGIFSASVAALFVISTYPRRFSKSRYASLIILLLAGYGIIHFLVPQYTWDRLSTIPEEIISGDLSGRLSIWFAGFEALGKNPLLGVGVGAYSSSVASILGYGRVAHNTLFEVLVEQGIVGFTIFAAFLVLVWSTALRSPPLTRRFWIFLLLTWTVGTMAMSWTHRKPSWFLFGLLVAQPTVIEYKRLSIRGLRNLKGYRLSSAVNNNS
jgi:O-antigen ligase